jgi:hypothetical protein
MPSLSRRLARSIQQFQLCETMSRALGQLLLRDAVSVAGAALTALCIASVLSLVATYSPTKKQAVIETIALKRGCVTSRCGTNVSAEH